MWASTSPVASSTLASSSTTGWPAGERPSACSPSTTWVTLGRPSRSRAPAPKPVRSMVIAGSGPKPVARAASRAAPVGVVSSTPTSRPVGGRCTPRAARRPPAPGWGAGRGRRGPCPCRWPPRTACTSSTPSTSRAAQVPTTSTMASSPPTSWKWTCSGGRRWSRPSASASAREHGQGPAADPVGQPGLLDQRRRCGRRCARPTVSSARTWTLVAAIPRAAPARPRAPSPPPAAARAGPAPRRGRPRRRPGRRGPCPRRSRRSSGTRRVASSAGRLTSRMRRTAQAAPKPLSMPTTVRPGRARGQHGQQGGDPLQRRRRSPTLVGTATTGAGVRPPDQAGQRPLHAGHHDDGVGRRPARRRRPAGGGRPATPTSVTAIGSKPWAREGGGALVGHRQVGGAGGAARTTRSGRGAAGPPHERGAGAHAARVGGQRGRGLRVVGPGERAPGPPPPSSSSATMAAHCSGVLPGP